jgi:hypothetical protein
MQTLPLVELCWKERSTAPLFVECSTTHDKTLSLHKTQKRASVGLQSQNDQPQLPQAVGSNGNESLHAAPGRPLSWRASQFALQALIPRQTHHLPLAQRTLAREKQVRLENGHEQSPGRTLPLRKQTRHRLGVCVSVF